MLILIIILIAITVIKGIQIGEFKILGITEIKQEDEYCDNYVCSDDNRRVTLPRE